VKILLVEDNPDTLRLLKRLLCAMGHEVNSAASVQGALEAAAEPFDLLISDIGLPDGSGWELMRQLNSTRPIKGVALSGFGTEEDLRKSREAGFITHLVKPIDVSRLEQVIEQITAAASVVRWA
jgi:CheY-like chemotaxis protein